jgi:hypothetical protein
MLTKSDIWCPPSITKVMHEVAPILDPDVELLRQRSHPLLLFSKIDGVALW